LLGTATGNAALGALRSRPGFAAPRFWPLLVANNQLLFNLEVGLSVFQFRYSVDYGKLMAGSTLSTLPMLIVFLLLRRRIIENMALTGIKG
jgi:ABC-type glycerol-3-phosphate transport system permease component